VTQRTFIVAYNYRVFRDYCREHGLTHAQAAHTGLIYATLPKLRDRAYVGGAEVQAKFIGEWADRADAHTILNRLSALDAVNVDTGRPVAEMVTAALEATAEAARELARGMRSTTQMLMDSSYTGESAGDRARRLSDLVPVPPWWEEREDAAPRTFVPPMPDGCSPVYLLDGPRQDMIYPVRNQHDVFITPWTTSDILTANGYADPAAFLARVMPPHPQYRVRTVNTCQLMASEGPHQFDPEICAQAIRVGLSGSENDYPALLQRAGQRILNSLTPQWEQLMRSRPQLLSQPVPPHGRYRTYTYPMDTPGTVYHGQAVRFRTADAPSVSVLPRLTWPSSGETDWPTPGGPVDYGLTCAHICGDDDHICDARAATSIVFTIPSGGQRSLPVCGPCYRAETAALAAQEATE
jgi:hypothetical protein